MPGRGDPVGRHMGPDKNGSLPDAGLPLFSVRAVETGTFEDPGNASCGVTRHFSKVRRQRTVGHDWPDAGHDEGDGRDEMRAELA
jgi:hypothetical protein